MTNPFEPNSSSFEKSKQSSEYSINSLKNLIEKEDSKFNIHSSISQHDNSQQISSVSNISNSKQSKPDLYSNIHKLLEENNTHHPLHPITKQLYNNQVNNSNQQYMNNSKSSNTVNTADVLSMQLELQENKKTIQMMKNKIAELKGTINKNELEYKEALTKKLNEQKFEYDNNLMRLNALIETSLSEKKKLNNKIEELNEQIALLNIQNQKKIQSLTENNEADNQKNKDAWYQAEKLRRKKWEEEKLKELKELTVKSLEPELDKILKDHKAELYKQEEELKDNFRNQKEKMIVDYEKKIQSLKHSFIKEKEAIQEEERKIYTKRLREQNERTEEEHNGEQKKWYINLQDEVTRLEQLRKKDKTNYENDLELSEKRHNKDIEEKEAYYRQKIMEFKETYEDKLQKQIETEKEIIAQEHQEYIKEKEREYEKRMNQFKSEMIQERDKKINVVIASLSDDLIKDKNKTHIELERKANTLNECLKEENKELKQTIQAYKQNEEEYKDKLRKALNNYEGSLKETDEKILEITNLKKEIDQLNLLINDLTDKYTGAQKGFNQEKINIEIAYQTDLHKTKKESQLLVEKNELVQKGFESKIADIQKEHKTEMEELEDRISKAMKRKDETITRLNNEILVKTQTIAKYEELLNKQRNEFIAQYSKNK